MSNEEIQEQQNQPEKTILASLAGLLMDDGGFRVEFKVGKLVPESFKKAVFLSLASEIQAQVKEELTRHEQKTEALLIGMRTLLESQPKELLEETTS